MVVASSSDLWQAKSQQCCLQNNICCTFPKMATLPSADSTRHKAKDRAPQWGWAGMHGTLNHAQPCGIHTRKAASKMLGSEPNVIININVVGQNKSLQATGNGSEVANEKYQQAKGKNPQDQKDLTHTGTHTDTHSKLLDICMCVYVCV